MTTFICENSNTELRRDLGVSQKSASHLGHYLQAGFASEEVLLAVRSRSMRFTCVAGNATGTPGWAAMPGTDNEDSQGCVPKRVRLGMALQTEWTAQ